jgi:heme-degrading monooxygenase HmoA
MHARLNIRQILPGKIDEFLETFEETVAPDVRKRPGYRGGLLLTDRSTGKAISLTLWETEADMRAVEAKGLLPVDYAKTAHLVAGPVAVERYEVSMQD